MSFKARSRLGSFGFALEGIVHVVRREPNMRIHLGCAALALATGLWFDIAAEDWRWVGLSFALVTTTECLNTAIERISDVADPSHNPLVKQAKDAAAGAVLITAAFAAVVGFSIFWSFFRFG